MADLEFDQDKMYSSAAFKTSEKTNSSLSGSLVRMGIVSGEKSANILLGVFALLIMVSSIYISWPDPDPINTIEILPGESVGVYI